MSTSRVPHTIKLFIKNPFDYVNVLKKHIYPRGVFTRE